MSNRVHKAFPCVTDLPNQLEFVGLHFDENGYRVLVSEFATEMHSLFEIDFGRSPLAQRSMDEGKFLATAWKAEAGIGPLVLVEGSDFIDWFQKESCGIFDAEKIFHVAILTQNEWVEVICEHLPLVRKVASDLNPLFQ